MTPTDADLSRFLRKTRLDPDSGCRLWTAGRDTNGYGIFWAQGTSWRAHRLAWIFSHGPIEDGRCVLHRCDTPACVNLAHLFLGTFEDNTRDMVAKGRQRWGGVPASAKLTKDQVRDIRKMLAGDTPQNAIAESFGVSPSASSAIRHGRLWARAEGTDHATVAPWRGPDHIGERNPLAKLSAETVLKIVERYRAGVQTLTAIGQEFGVSRTAVGHIVHGRRWAHVTGITAERVG